MLKWARDGTPLEQTTHVAQALGRFLGGQPEVISCQIHAGTSGPYNFNGLVRHHFLRSQPNQADIQVNLLSRHDRKAQSHEIARRLRPELDKIGVPFGARIKVAEVPPGPPVLQTLVAEVYGPDYKGQIELAAQIKKVFHQTPRVVDVDWYVEDPETKYDVKVDLEKTALPHPYIEWYSDANCRVVLELDPPQVGIVKSDSLRKEKMADWRLHLPAQRTES